MADFLSSNPTFSQVVRKFGPYMLGLALLAFFISVVFNTSIGMASTVVVLISILVGSAALLYRALRAG